ncbi:SprT-like family-domain-containing protein [Umbelopsis sp. AD052]|nr:SprT-like family-domain-containing protein [Umbelopsis sp. AD052]
MLQSIRISLLSHFQKIMAAEDSERLARRLQAEEDKLTELILHEAKDEALARRLHEQYQLEASTKTDSEALISLLDETAILNHTPNSVTNSRNDIESDEALARLLQAEEEQNAKTSVHGETSTEHRSPPPHSSSSQLKADEEFARLLQEQEADSSHNDEQIGNELELFSPTPDIHALFQVFDEQYFYGMLKVVELKWSKKMTLCAGICSYKSTGQCTISLSEPLLQFRTREDLIDTLLHEMIHALLFVTDNYADHDGHGPQFLMHAARINKAAGTKITVYHTFHDEVNYHRTHVWKCNGPCQQQPPFYGIVRRSMNRPPQKADYWWARHQIQCGGTYTKISEPEKKATTKQQKTKEPDQKQPRIDGFLKRSESSSASDKAEAAAKRRNLGGSS